MKERYGLDFAWFDRSSVDTTVTATLLESIWFAVLGCRPSFFLLTFTMLVLAGLPLYFENPIGRLYEHPDGYVVVDYNAGARKLTEFQAFLHHLEHLLRRHGDAKLRMHAVLTGLALLP